VIGHKTPARFHPAEWISVVGLRQVLRGLSRRRADRAQTVLAAFFLRRETGGNNGILTVIALNWVMLTIWFSAPVGYCDNCRSSSTSGRATPGECMCVGTLNATSATISVTAQPLR
jgi:hypothetical protein